jgi:hypothetical protein
MHGESASRTYGRESGLKWKWEERRADSIGAISDVLASIGSGVEVCERRRERSREMTPGERERERVEERERPPSG